MAITVREFISYVKSEIAGEYKTFIGEFEAQEAFKSLLVARHKHGWDLSIFSNPKGGYDVTLKKG